MQVFFFRFNDKAVHEQLAYSFSPEALGYQYVFEIHALTLPCRISYIVKGKCYNNSISFSYKSPVNGIWSETAFFKMIRRYCNLIRSTLKGCQFLYQFEHAGTIFPDSSSDFYFHNQIN